MTRCFGSRVRGDQDKFDREAYDDCDNGDSLRARRFTDARHEVRKTQRQQRSGDEELEGLHPQRFTADRSVINNDQKSRHNSRDGIDDCESELEPIQGEARHATALKKETLVELRGFEPLTFSLRTRRATNCATAPCVSQDNNQSPLG